MPCKTERKRDTYLVKCQPIINNVDIVWSNALFAICNLWDLDFVSTLQTNLKISSQVKFILDDYRLRSNSFV